MALSSNPLVAGNWKMNGLHASLAEVAAVAAAVERGEAGRASVAICPPATLLRDAVARAGSQVLIGGQDCAATASGAHTGDIAAEMLADAGARLVIVGHSERRHDHGETDETVHAKTLAAHRAGLVAIICVGETRQQRDDGHALDVVARQLDHSVPRSATAQDIVVAYEPVWAIGTGLVPTEANVAEMHAFIRRRLTANLSGGAGVRILYGGSVKPDNCQVLMKIDNVDGALVGGASLKAKDFMAITAAYR